MLMMIENSDSDVDKSNEDDDDSISTQLIDNFFKMQAHINEFYIVALILTM
jgi:hypothetical protein